MTLEVFVADEQSDHELDCERWAVLAKGALVLEGITDDAELSVLFVDSGTIEALNERFLFHKGPTDVLSFPIEDGPDIAGRAPDGGGNGPGWEPSDSSSPTTLLGDVIICPTVAASNAPDHGHCFEDEIALLLVHGILHLLGMDHEIDAEAEQMEAREQEILTALYGDSSTGK